MTAPTHVAVPRKRVVTSATDVVRQVISPETVVSLVMVGEEVAEARFDATNATSWDTSP